VDHARLLALLESLMSRGRPSVSRLSGRQGG
jgi:hypothetical protein